MRTVSLIWMNWTTTMLRQTFVSSWSNESNYCSWEKLRGWSRSKSKSRKTGRKNSRCREFRWGLLEHLIRGEVTLRVLIRVRIRIRISSRTSGVGRLVWVSRNRSRISCLLYRLATIINLRLFSKKRIRPKGTSSKKKTTYLMTSKTGTTDFELNITCTSAAIC